MDKLKNVLFVIVGIFIISSFTNNEKKELSSGEKNIELIKKLLQENEFKSITLYAELTSNDFFKVECSASEITFDDNYIIVKGKNEQYYFEAGKISYLNPWKSKKGQQLKIKLL